MNDASDAAQPMVAAVLLAGGATSEAFQAMAGVPNRALAEIGGRPMIEIVLDAVRGSRWIGRIVLVGGPELDGIGPVDARLPPGDSLVANITAGIRACDGFAYVLLVTADLPFLTSEAVDRMIEAGIASGGGLCYPAIRKEDNERVFPGMRRTYVHLADGDFTGGNLVLVRPDVLLANEARVARAHAARKKPWQVALIFGLPTLWRLLRGTLTIAAAEARASVILGVSARVLLLPYPQLGADIDRPEDLETARRLKSKD
jgi:molybdopterin-guanine dinucleotide biosynthesis protein A